MQSNSSRKALLQKGAIQSNPFYNREGNLREHFIPLCQELKIDPSDLCLKTSKDFSGPDVSEKVQSQKFQVYESQRLTKLNFLKTLASERHMLKPKPPQEPVMMKSALRGFETQRPPQILVNSSHLKVSDMKSDGMLNSTPARSNFFFTELPDSQSCRAQRGIMSELTTPVNFSSEQKKVRIITNPQGSISHNRSSQSFSIDPMNHKEKNVKSLIMKDFEKTLEERIKKSERLFNASASALKQEEDTKERRRENWNKKEEKLAKVMVELAKKKKMKFTKTNEVLKQHKEKKIMIDKEAEKTRVAMKKSFTLRMAEFDQKKQEMDDDRAKRIIDAHQSYTDRQHLYMERKIKLESLSIPALSHIEKKLMNSTMRKQRNLTERMQSMKNSNEIEEKQKWKKEVEETEQQRTLEKFIGKMLKKQNLQASQVKLKRTNSSPMAAKHMEHLLKADAIKQQEAREIKERTQEIKDRLRRGELRIQEHKEAMSEFLAERRELYSVRDQIAKSNRNLVIEAEERRAKEIINSYQSKVDLIRKDKVVMQKRREKVQELTRNLFERRPVGI